MALAIFTEEIHLNSPQLQLEDFWCGFGEKYEI